MTYTSHAPIDLHLIDPDPFGSEEQIDAFFDLHEAEMESSGAIEK